MVDGVPDGAAGVGGEAFGVVDQTDIVAFGGGGFILRDTVVALVALVVIFNDAAFADVFTECALERFLLAPFFLEFFARVSGFGALEFTEFLCSPDFGNVFLVLECVDCTCYVATCSCAIIPGLDGALLVVEVQPVVCEEVCVLCDVFQRRCESVV